MPLRYEPEHRGGGHSGTLHRSPRRAVADRRARYGGRRGRAAADHRGGRPQPRPPTSPAYCRRARRLRGRRSATARRRGSIGDIRVRWRIRPRRNRRHPRVHGTAGTRAAQPVHRHLRGQRAHWAIRPVHFLHESAAGKAAAAAGEPNCSAPVGGYGIQERPPGATAPDSRSASHRRNLRGNASRLLSIWSWRRRSKRRHTMEACALTLAARRPNGRSPGRRDGDRAVRLHPILPLMTAHAQQPQCVDRRPLGPPPTMSVTWQVRWPVHARRGCRGR